MYEKYKTKLNLAQDKLSLIDFSLEKSEDNRVVFGNGSIWKVDFNGKWYDDYSFLSIRNEKFFDTLHSLNGTPVWVLMKIFGVKFDIKDTKKSLDFIVDYNQQIFNEALYLKKFIDGLKNGVK